MTTVTRTAADRLLRPDWERPATWLPHLAAHLAAPDPGALHLDATGDDPPAAVVLAMLSQACGALAGARPLPEIVLHDDPAELVSHAGLPAPEVGPEIADEPERSLARARTAKLVADAARAHVDRWRYERAPAPGRRDPLVSVRIPTWRGHETLVDRTLPSVLGGHYEHLEVVVCSDGPDPLARAAVEEVARRDPRVRFLELPERPVYPRAKINLHRIGGTAAANATIDAARGDFVCPLDHDDAFTYDHVSTLLGACERANADFAYGQSVCEVENGVWSMNGFEPLRHGGISHGSVMWSSRLAHMRYDADAWLLREPGDWNMFRRMAQAGSVPAYIRATVLVHFAERTSIDSVDVVPPEATVEQALADLRATGAGWLLRTPIPAAA
jgi:hypothetical protein